MTQHRFIIDVEVDDGLAPPAGWTPTELLVALELGRVRIEAAEYLGEALPGTAVPNLELGKAVAQDLVDRLSAGRSVSEA